MKKLNAATGKRYRGLWNEVSPLVRRDKQDSNLLSLTKAKNDPVRSFRNDVAVWWEEAIPSDNSPKMLKVITTNWKRFEIVFRRAWKIKATLTSVSWMENNRQKPNESIAAFITRVQSAVATTSREALTNKANDVKDKDVPDRDEAAQGPVPGYLLAAPS
jgi:hypothetical protein